MKLIKKEITETLFYELFDEVILKVSVKFGKIINSKIISESPHFIRKSSTPYFVKDKFFELIKTENPWNIKKNTWDDSNFVYTNEELVNMVSKGSFDLPKENLVWAYHYGHILFNHNGEPIPIPFYYDYIGTPFSNEYCDIKKMLPHLKKHPWVINGDKLIIDFVPWYNNDTGCKKYIKEESTGIIRILPDKDSYLKIYKRAIELDKEFFSVKMKELIVSGKVYNWKIENEKDWLGIKKFMIS